MSTVEPDVKKYISDIAGLPAPADNTKRLCDLNFNDDMCSDLADELDGYVKQQNPNAGVDDDEITSSLSIQQVISLVNKKLTP